MKKVPLPTIHAVSHNLREIKATLDRGDMCDVRLQLLPSGGWQVHTGDPCYDQDHRGYWGDSCIDSRTNCRDLARDLIDQCADHLAQSTK
jgi:hypothetical protein